MINANRSAVSTQEPMASSVNSAMIASPGFFVNEPLLLMHRRLHPGQEFGDFVGIQLF